MQRKFNIAIDIDGVLRDVVYTAVNLYNEAFAEKTGKSISRADVTEYNFRNSMPELEDPVRWIFVENMHSVLHNSPAFSGIKEALQMLKPFCNITILSKQPSKLAQECTTHWLWLQGIGDLADEICMFCDHKRNHTSRYDIVVDDYPENFRGMRNDQLAVLISAPYNLYFEEVDKLLEDWMGGPCELPTNFVRFCSLLEFAKGFTSFIRGAVNCSEDGLY